MQNDFSKKVFSFKIFFSDLGFLIRHFFSFFTIKKNKQISNAFNEKIMTIITAVNGCPYCAWFHAKKALESGITQQEINQMMELQFQTVASDFELPALLYAQHFAETNRQPDQDMTLKFFKAYDQKTAEQIIFLIRMIFFGNLYGNTWEAIFSRFKGKPAANSNFFFEIFFFLTNFLFFLPFHFYYRLDSQKK